MVQLVDFVGDDMDRVMGGRGPSGPDLQRGLQGAQLGDVLFACGVERAQTVEPLAVGVLDWMVGMMRCCKWCACRMARMASVWWVSSHAYPCAYCPVFTVRSFLHCR